MKEDSTGAPQSAGPPPRILFLAHTHAFGAFRVGSHHYAREFARRGADVVHLSTPISKAHLLTGRVDRAQAATVPVGPHCDEDGVIHLVPRTIAPTPYGRFRVARELKKYGFDPVFDAILIDQPLLWDDTVPTLSRRLVYRPTDLYPSGPKARLQRTVVASADGVVATSDEVLRRLGPLEVPALVLGNGVDAARFSPAQNRTAPRSDLCVYVGAIDGRFDWQQVRSWAQQHPGARFVIAGPVTVPPADLPPNIELPGPIPYDSLPALLHDARVGLLPLSEDPLNAGRSPMKLYEYFAAGLAVVARETPVLHEDTEAGLHTFTNATDGDNALRRAMSHISPNVEGMLRAASEAWDLKADSLAAFIERLPGRRPQRTHPRSGELPFEDV